MSISTGKPHTHRILTFDAAGKLYDMVELDLETKLKSGLRPAYERNMLNYLIFSIPLGGHIKVEDIRPGAEQARTASRQVPYSDMLVY